MSELLTPEEVAERLKARLSTVLRWLRMGRLKGTRLGGTKMYRIRADDLERFIDGEETPAAPEGPSS